MRYLVLFSLVFGAACSDMTAPVARSQMAPADVHAADVTASLPRVLSADSARLSPVCVSLRTFSDSLIHADPTPKVGIDPVTGLPLGRVVPACRVMPRPRLPLSIP